MALELGFLTIMPQFPHLQNGCSISTDLVKVLQTLMEPRLSAVARGANARCSSSLGDMWGLCDTSQASLFPPLSAPELGWGLLHSKHTGAAPVQGWAVGQALQPTSSLEESLLLGPALSSQPGPSWCPALC